MKLSKKQKYWAVSGLILIGLFCAWQTLSTKLNSRLQADYIILNSRVVYDRTGTIIEVNPNSRGNYDQFTEAIPPRVAQLLLKKEDRFFYLHPGFNPLSLARDFYSYLITGRRAGSSTITQQLVKTLLANENQRSWKNKITELIYTEALEWNNSKKSILTMYLNSAYFGSQSEGLKQASLDNFGSPPETLNDAQILSLLAALNSPSQNQPGTATNIKYAKNLANKFRLSINDSDWMNLSPALAEKSSRSSNAAFEVNSLNLNCPVNCQTTLDAGLTQNIRAILKRDLTSQALDTAENGAVVVIKLPENQILSIVGSPDPSSPGEGMQLDMAVKPRPIGSTSKPFIYMNAFEEGARPFSLVDDTEMKYELASGFDFFPKNFDGQYRGLVTLHQALDNSLNIPSVQVLEFVGLDHFYKFMYDQMGFTPLQPLESYELGIALGGLESDLLTLSNYFTIFPNQGVLKPLTLYQETLSPYYKDPMAKLITEPKQVGQEPMVELVNRVLNDRDTGVNQFGIESSLNLPYTNYGVKTGTSRDYHDSWTMGYTPDFLVGVWVGNSNNTAMRQITGLAGAAKVWHEVMQVMYNSEYNKNTPFNFSKIREIQSGNTLDFGLDGDDYNTIRNIMLKNNLILSPHQDDKYLLLPGTTIPLSASQEVTWSVNGQFFAKSQKSFWPPPSPGTYTISAESSDGKTEQVTININKK
ncbi:MAG: transglycosylase domain-containing protein [Candidatus Doudnabacteria bacterium]|nr:transglycosylase domain-containing protein [Candidatus Doudnabacteria bacterium]